MYSATTKYLLVALIYTLTYIYSIEYAPGLVDCETPQCQKMIGIHESCVYGCGDGNPLLKGRGGSYIIGVDDPARNNALSNCLVTFWGLGHFITYGLLGMVAPDMFWQTFAVGVGFEAYEAYRFDCHDVFDIVLNSAGFLAGRTVNRVISSLKLLDHS